MTSAWKGSIKCRQFNQTPFFQEKKTKTWLQSWVTCNKNMTWWVTLWLPPPLAELSCVGVVWLRRVSGLCGFIAEFLSLFGDLMCQSIFLGWSLMGLFVFSAQKNTLLNPAWIQLAVLSYLPCLWYKLSYNPVYMEAMSCPSCPHYVPL